MIYKFIDNNGSEISVNSLSSLQALVDSETVKENTKVKAGLRGKWTTASKIDELVFAKEEIKEPEESHAPLGDIKSFITKEEKTEEVSSETKLEYPPPESKPDDVSAQPWQTKKENVLVKEVEEITKEKDETEEEKFEYDLEEDKRNKLYDDENVIGLNLFNSIGSCFKNFFNFRDRASRSEYWYFQLVFTIVSIPLFIYEDSSNDTHLIYSGISAIIVLLLFVPAISVSVRRLHDIDKSGWFVLISVIPFIGWVILAIMLIGKGTEGKNQFGEYPLSLIKK